MKKKLSLALVLFAILITVLPTAIPAYAASTTYTATKVYALALGCPYHVTLSVQNNDLVVNGTAPDYVDGASLNTSLIKPVNYTSCTVGADGSATVTKDTTVNFASWRTMEQLKPTIIKTLTHPLTGINDIAPLITVTDSHGDKVVTEDIANVPKLDLSDIQDGVYNIRASLSTDPSYICLYCDDVLLVVQGGKASLQVLLTYVRYITYGGGSTIYEGYSLDKWDVRPATTITNYDRWLLGLPQE